MKNIFVASLLIGLSIGAVAFAQSPSAPSVVQISATPPSETVTIMPIDMQGGTGGDENALGKDMSAEVTSASAPSPCKLNGEYVPCEQLTGYAKMGFKILGGILLLSFIALIFWLFMLIHAIKNPIPNKAIWIICFIIFGVITAIVYYFAVWRSYLGATATTPLPTPPLVPPQV